MRALTALSVVHKLTGAGLSAPNPTRHDGARLPRHRLRPVDRHRYPQSQIVPYHHKAERYALPRGLYQVETVVVAFAPPLSEAERARYRAEIQKLVD
jgi:hypothetical protein